MTHRFYGLKSWLVICIILSSTFYSLGQITKQPNGDTVCYNGSTSFIIKAGTTDKFTWQEYSTGWATLLGSSGGTFSGITDDTLTVSAAKATKILRCRVDSAGQGIKFFYSDSIILNVWDALGRPKISSNGTICFNAHSDSIKRIQRATGGDGQFTYQWQQLNSNWTSLSGLTDSTFITGLLTSDKLIRLLATNLCGSVISDTVKITVLSTPTKPGISASKPICNGAISDTLKILQNPTGSFTPYSYQWEEEINGTWSTIVNKTNASFVSDALTSSAQFRLRATGSCGSVTSDPVYIEVYREFSGAKIKGNDTICYNTSPNLIEIAQFPAGGDTTTAYLYQWQKSIDNSNWDSITGAKLSNYSPNNLTSTTYYRLINSSASFCGSYISDTVKVLVYPEATIPSIEGAESICYGDTAKKVKLTIPSGGGNGVFDYQWQQSSNNIHWTNTNMQGANFIGYTLYSSRYYRLKASTFECDTVYSAPVFVEVFKLFDIGTITNSKSICYNSLSSVNFIKSPSGGGNNYSYQWEESPDSVNFTKIPSANSTSFSTTLIDTFYYRVIVSSTENCGEDTSNVCKVIVYGNFEKPTINVNGNTIICYNQQANVITTTKAPEGGGDSKNYQYSWLKSENGTDWNPLSHNQDWLSPGNLKKTSYYKLKSTSAEGCGEVISDSVHITVRSLPDTTIKINGDSINCRNQKETVYRLSEDSLYSYRWEIKAGSGTVMSYFYDSALVYINWLDVATTDTIKVIQTDTLTGCSSTIYKPIVLDAKKAPDKATIIRKQASTILVCGDTSNGLKYQWGYSIKSSGGTVENISDTLRYVRFNEIDTLKYTYYVKTSFAGCVTTSYYHYDPTIFSPMVLSVIEPSDDKPLIYPNPAINGRINILLPGKEITNVTALSLSGQIVNAIYNPATSVLEFPEMVAAGMYVLCIHTENQIFYSRVII